MENNSELKKMTPSQILVNSFLIIIAAGTILLMLPIATVDGKGNDFITALFMTTSAVAVTGLAVIDISTKFTIFGQVVIMVLVQLGGIGIMTFSSIIMMMIGKRISYNEKVILKEGLNQDSMGGIIRFIRRVIKIILLIEGIGAVILTMGFMRTMPLGKAIYYGIFHAVSAFCNAGFALFPNNLIAVQKNPLIILTIAFLIIIGGIGFGVISGMIEYYRSGTKKLSLTSKLAMKITFVLLLIGTLVVLIVEYSNMGTLGKMNIFEKIINAFFQSVTTRTAGFNSLDIAKLQPATIFVFLILMFIGASPGSTGGGIKTTTFGVILYSVIANIKNRKHVEIENRTISWKIINRAFTILIISISYITIITCSILLFEKIGIVEVIFEVISAFGTVGLSMGITPSLSVFSKILIILTMFIGRVGPLTFVLALGEEEASTKYKYPEENVIVG